MIMIVLSSWPTNQSQLRSYQTSIQYSKQQAAVIIMLYLHDLYGVYN